MKYLLFLGFLSFGFLACEAPRHLQFTTPTNEPIRPQETLLPFPVKAHEKNVEIFFSGVSNPANPFLQLKYLIQTGNGHEDIQPLLDQLQKRAQAYGADGIIVTNVTRRYRDTWRGEVFVQYPLTDVEALAYVYPESVSFVPGQLKAWVEYSYVDSLDTWNEVYSQEYDMKGREIKSDKQVIHLNWWLRRNHDNLMYSTNIKKATVFDSQQRPVQRFPDDTYKIRISYVDDTKRISEIRMDFAQASEHIKYVFDETNTRVVKRIFKTSISNNLIFEEMPHYDDSGNIVHYQVDRIFSGVRKPHFKVKPVYYTEEDFEELLAKTIKEELGDISSY